MRLLTHEDLKAKGIRYSRPWLMQMEKDGKFPKRVQLSPGRIAWPEPEVDDWICQKIEERDKGAA